MIQRRISRQVLVGGIAIGAHAPIVVQSMTNTDTADAAATVAQSWTLLAQDPNSCASR